MQNYHDLFEDYTYQEFATELLYSSLQKGRIAPTYLFTGPLGVGQKEIALRFFEGLINRDSNETNTRILLDSGNHPDLLIVEPTYLYQGKIIPKSTAKVESFKTHLKPQIRVEQIKDLKNFLSKKPIKSKLSMVIIDEMETINEAASNSILKTIEEPISGVIILISTRPDALLDTIKSRCQTIPFKPFNKILLKREILENKFEKEFNLNHNEILSLSYGSPILLRRNLENYSSIPQEIFLKVKQLPNKNPLDALLLAKEITEELLPDQQFWLIDWMQQYYWEKTIDSKIIKILGNLKTQLKSYINQRIAWEMTLINLMKLD